MSFLSHPFRSIFVPLRRYISSLLRWHLPLEGKLALTRKNIGIFPGRAGWAYLLLMTVLWLVATNYENNLVMGLVFLLTSLFVVSIWHTFFNVSGLTISYLGCSPCFAGEDACFELLVEKHQGEPCENIVLRWGQAAPVVVNLLEGASQRVKIYVPASRRGWLKPGRLIVESYYPLGIFRAWVALRTDCRALVYPKPIVAGEIPPVAGSHGEEGELSHLSGNEDFAGFKAYYPGASLRQVAWKQYARGAGLNLKDYAASLDRHTWLDWDFLGGMEREVRLSRLCYWVLMSARQNDLYGLRLPGHEIPPARGEQHQAQALKTLALYEWQAGGGR